MRKVAEIAVGVVFLLSFYSMLAISQYYTRHMPPAPDPATTRMVPVAVNYGKTVYVTAVEKRWLNLSQLAVGISGVLMLVVLVRVVNSRGSSSWPTGRP